MLHLAVELLGDLFQRGRDLPARTAPFGPEIDDHRGRGFEHLGLESVVGYLLSCHLLLLIAGAPRNDRSLLSSSETRYATPMPSRLVGALQEALFGVIKRS